METFNWTKTAKGTTEATTENGVYVIVKLAEGCFRAEFSTAHGVGFAITPSKKDAKFACEYADTLRMPADLDRVV